jgi:hypothetical protein
VANTMKGVGVLERVVEQAPGASIMTALVDHVASVSMGLKDALQRPFPRTFRHICLTMFFALPTEQVY